MKLNLAIFAYNEAPTIRRALDSLLAAAPVGAELRVFVLINGCTDDTLEVVRDYAKTHPEVVPVEIALGDKCNAWNLYVHELADERADVHFFTDGDCWCSPRALEIMAECLSANPQATAVAGVPQSGRSRATYHRYQRDWGWVYGGLYGVRGDHLMKMRDLGVRLPLGLKGNDHFITKLMHAPLPNTTQRVPEQVVFDERAGYCFDTLRPWRPADLRLYWNRLVTYDLRQRQIPLLNDLPLDELPETVDDVNRQILNRLETDPRRRRPVVRAVRRRLQRMYPTPEADCYAGRLAKLPEVTIHDGVGSASPIAEKASSLPATCRVS